MSGSNGARYGGFHVVDSANPVRPWKPPVNDTMPRPGFCAAWARTRANLSAASTPSVPELQKNTCS